MSNIIRLPLTPATTPVMHDRDCLHRFLFEHYPIRGHIVHLDASWRALLEHREYPPVIRDTLGEAVAASVLLAATLKFDGMLSLQLKGQGPMHLMLAQCSDALGVRAVARYKDADFRPDLASLSGEGSLTVTVENEDLSQRYQGIVPLNGERLSDCLRNYFETSEQLPTRLWLHADEHGASGLLLQRLSDDSVKSRTVGSRAHEMNRAEIEDAWNRVQLLGDTLKPEELQTLSDRNILRRLFAEDDVRLFESAPVFFKCRCSRERVVGMLKALGPEEVRSVLAEQGHVEVRCDFCNRAYRFDSVDVEQLFANAATPTTDAPDRRH
ncbi:33 kDa chaperonin [Steroidobacter agaridevorans]|uniref:33 kDa chaperonin n=1 Tax=Steroidobacter agaridevorans TaxID=2695856 RepID=A0A829YIA8_9GAMM|nr:Hsp33 family molecular chaperone HslO [Steroidobacter agaridevorans]GFE83037.1 33 kDa chaperonin [Steroidobacter agaridevorans]GFE86117.1 33 kDa chaperonin [Steroidobacter agaridevorans]